MTTAITDQQLRIHYAATSFARMGIPFERAMQIDPLRILVEGAARAEARDRMARETADMAE